MKTFFFLLIALFAFVPGRLIVAAMPPLWVAQRFLPDDVRPFAPVGPVDFSPVDLIVMLLIARLIFSIAMEKQLVVHGGLYLAIGAYLVVNLLATLMAGIKFGSLPFVRSAASLARFVFELSVLPIVVQAVRTPDHARLCIRVLLGTLVALGAIQFINFFGVSHGIVIGEVQGAERGELRYFGPVGDSVGMVLLLGYLASLCFANVAATGLFLGGILLTAGVGAIFATAVGTGLFFLFGLRTAPMREFAHRRLWLVPVLGLAVLAGAFVVAKPLASTLLDRIRTGNFSTSGAQRAASAKYAEAMIADNPLLGVGYMGYEQMLEHYGGGAYFDLDHPDGGTANANNQILQSLTDGGIAGLLAFGALVYCAAGILWRAAGRSDDRLIATFFVAAFLWLLAQVFGNLAAVWLNPGSFVARLAWVSLGLAVAVTRHFPTDESQRSASAATRPKPNPVPA